MEEIVKELNKWLDERNVIIDVQFTVETVLGKRVILPKIVITPKPEDKTDKK